MLLLKREHDRLKTFRNLHLDERKSHKLARSGFFYTNLKDVVKCYYCSLELFAMNCSDDVEAEHIRLSPNCFYVNGKDVCGPFNGHASSNLSMYACHIFKILTGALIVLGLCCEIYLLFKSYEKTGEF